MKTWIRRCLSPLFDSHRHLPGALKTRPQLSGVMFKTPAQYKACATRYLPSH